VLEEVMTSRALERELVGVDEKDPLRL